MYTLYRIVDIVHIFHESKLMSIKPLKRDTYRHGDLYRTLLSAAVRLAAVGGANAVVLREVTRQAGVSPNAAYRHFSGRQALLQAVSWAAQSALAIAIETEMDAINESGDATQVARARFRAVGTGYLKFALSQPGLFRTAFSVHNDLTQAANLASAGKSGLTPFQLLNTALDSLVEVGALSRERRLSAEFFAWSAVHGFAILLIDGPLRVLDKSQVEAIRQQLIDNIVRGL